MMIGIIVIVELPIGDAWAFPREWLGFLGLIGRPVPICPPRMHPQPPRIQERQAPKLSVLGIVQN